MPIDHSTLTKGQVRKLNAFRKSIGDDIAEDAFAKWMKTQSKTSKEVRDPVADALVTALDQFKDDKTFRLGAKGYVVKRSKGKGASGFIAQKVVWVDLTQTNGHPPLLPPTAKLDSDIKKMARNFLQAIFFVVFSVNTELTLWELETTFLSI